MHPRALILPGPDSNPFRDFIGFLLCFPYFFFLGAAISAVIGLLGIAYCPLLLILAPSYYWFLIAFMPFGFFVGLFSPSSQSQISMIESKR